MGKKPTHLRVVGKEERPLTGKQEAFAKLVAGGAVLSDAYRECYSADSMKDSTVWSEACRLAQNPKVSARIRSIQADNEQSQRMRLLRREEWVLKSLQEEAVSADNASSRIRALELVGKTIGMFTDRVEQTDTTERSASDIERELRAKLERLARS
jgi:hypothetical protein